MSKHVHYTFVVVRYVHDIATGESLNVGVVVYSPETRDIELRVEQRFERLSRAFAGFDGDSYRLTLKRLVSAVREMKRELERLPGLYSSPPDALSALREIWPDLGVSFTTGPQLSGIASDSLTGVANELFGRMVLSQMPEREVLERRSDEEVWTVFQKSLRAANVSHRLGPKVFKGQDFEIKFDHAFQNERWHAIEPVTMDFVRVESLQEKATRVLGTATALSGHPQLGKLHILLGAPRQESHRNAYVKAKNLLHKMPVRHEIVEEEDAEAFAAELAAYMKEHGIIDPPER